MNLFEEQKAVRFVRFLEEAEEGRESVFTDIKRSTKRHRSNELTMQSAYVETRIILPSSKIREWDSPMGMP